MRKTAQSPMSARVPLPSLPIELPTGNSRTTFNVHGVARVSPSVPSAEALAGMPPLEASEIQSPDGYFWVRADMVDPMPNQPRQYFDPAEMNLLQDSIAEYGQQEAVWLLRMPDGRYQLIEGERRWRCILALKLPYLKAVFKTAKNRTEQYVKAIMGNHGKLGHPATEIADQMAQLRSFPEFRGMSQSQLVEAFARIYTKSTGWVQYHLSLLGLCQEVRVMMSGQVPEEKRLPVMAGAFISTIQDRNEQVHVATKAINEGMSVVQIREYARGRAASLGVPIGKRPRRPSDDYLQFGGFLRRTLQGIGLFRDMNQQRFETMFRSRSRRERSEMLQTLQQIVSRLNEMITILRRVDES